MELSSKRVDVTLKKNVDSQLPKPDSCSFSSLHVGDVVTGHIRRVETYGLFIAIDGTNLVSKFYLTLRYSKLYLRTKLVAVGMGALPFRCSQSLIRIKYVGVVSHEDKCFGLRLAYAIFQSFLMII